jgi:hypothetical protein
LGGKYFNLSNSASLVASIGGMVHITGQGERTIGLSFDFFTKKLNIKY